MHLMHISSQHVGVKGLSTHMVRVGTGDISLVMLHGWGGCTNSFLGNAGNVGKSEKNLKHQKTVGLAQLLATKLGWTVLVVDVPGFGQSSAPDENGWYTYQFADWLKALITTYKLESVPLLGHSNGWRIITQYVLHYGHAGPLIALGGAGVVWPLTRRQQLTKKISSLFRRVRRFLPDSVYRFIVAKVLRAHDWANVKPAMRESLRKIMSEGCVRESLRLIPNKTLLVWGANDTMTPLRSGEVFAQNMPNATLKVLPTGRHGIHKTHATEIAQWIELFLQT